jgi:membrane glycosyltransferase
LFLAPEEVDPPAELAGLNDAEGANVSRSPAWAQALLCPYVEAVHLSLVRLRDSDAEDPPDHAEMQKREQLLREGPEALGARERLRLLWDAEAVYWLHQELWARPNSDLHPSWIIAQQEAADCLLLRRYLLTDGI